MPRPIRVTNGLDSIAASTTLTSALIACVTKRTMVECTGLSRIIGSMHIPCEIQYSGFSSFRQRKKMTAELRNTRGDLVTRPMAKAHPALPLPIVVHGARSQTVYRTPFATLHLPVSSLLFFPLVETNCGILSAYDILKITEHQQALLTTFTIASDASPDGLQ